MAPSLYLRVVVPFSLLASSNALGIDCGAGGIASLMKQNVLKTVIKTSGGYHNNEYIELNSLVFGRTCESRIVEAVQETVKEALCKGKKAGQAVDQAVGRAWNAALKQQQNSTKWFLNWNDTYGKNGNFDLLCKEIEKEVTAQISSGTKSLCMDPSPLVQAEKPERVIEDGFVIINDDIDPGQLSVPRVSIGVQNRETSSLSLTVTDIDRPAKLGKLYAFVTKKEENILDIEQKEANAVRRFWKKIPSVPSIFSSSFGRKYPRWKLVQLEMCEFFGFKTAACEDDIPRELAQFQKFWDRTAETRVFNFKKRFQNADHAKYAIRMLHNIAVDCANEILDLARDKGSHAVGGAFQEGGKCEYFDITDGDSAPQKLIKKETHALSAVEKQAQVAIYEKKKATGIFGNVKFYTKKILKGLYRFAVNGPLENKLLEVLKRNLGKEKYKVSTANDHFARMKNELARELCNLFDTTITQGLFTGTGYSSTGNLEQCNWTVGDSMGGKSEDDATYDEKLERDVVQIPHPNVIVRNCMAAMMNLVKDKNVAANVFDEFLNTAEKRQWWATYRKTYYSDADVTAKFSILNGYNVLMAERNFRKESDALAELLNGSRRVVTQKLQTSKDHKALGEQWINTITSEEVRTYGQLSAAIYDKKFSHYQIRDEKAKPKSEQDDQLTRAIAGVQTEINLLKTTAANLKKLVEEKVTGSDDAPKHETKLIKGLKMQGLKIEDDVDGNEITDASAIFKKIQNQQQNLDRELQEKKLVEAEHEDTHFALVEEALILTGQVSHGYRLEHILYRNPGSENGKTKTQCKELSGIILYNEDKEELLFVMAGSKSAMDLFNDFYAGTAKPDVFHGSLDGFHIHTGFLKGFEQVQGSYNAFMMPWLERWLARQQKKKQPNITPTPTSRPEEKATQPNVTLTIRGTGHSLGGALAELFTISAVQMAKETLKIPVQAGVITFGAPNVFASIDIEKINKIMDGRGNFIRIQDRFDPVPRACFWKESPGVAVVGTAGLFSDEAGSFEWMGRVNPHSSVHYANYGYMIVESHKRKGAKLATEIGSVDDAEKKLKEAREEQEREVLHLEEKLVKALRDYQHYKATQQDLKFVTAEKENVSTIVKQHKTLLKVAQATKLTNDSVETLLTHGALKGNLDNLTTREGELQKVVAKYENLREEHVAAALEMVKQEC